MIVSPVNACGVKPEPDAGKLRACVNPRRFNAGTAKTQTNDGPSPHDDEKGQYLRQEAIS